ncbi:MAG: hypothetical protein Q9194_001409 [Teloschistes cf. exilis]
MVCWVDEQRLTGIGVDCPSPPPPPTSLSSPPSPTARSCEQILVNLLAYPEPLPPPDVADPPTSKSKNLGKREPLSEKQDGPVKKPKNVEKEMVEKQEGPAENPIIEEEETVGKGRRKEGERA